MPVSLLPELFRHRHSLGRGQVNARFAKWCREHGLNSPTDFLDLPGEVISGHRDRHVVEVRVGGRKMFLKKEHRVSLATRLRNWWAGFGMASLCEREAMTLTRLHEAGVPVPQWIACGSSQDGRSFVLLRNANGRELPTALARGTNDFTRWRLAHAIGEAVGRLHQSGFDSPDLSAKHVLVRRDGSVVLIDWPRAVERETLNRDRCLAALAGLHASLAPPLATMRERLAVLKIWMRTIGFHGPAAPLARQVIRLAKTMSRRRSIQEQLRPTRDPRLRWIDGEALCVTTSYLKSAGGEIPAWIRQGAQSTVPWRTVEVHAGSDFDPVVLCSFPPASRCRRWFSALSRSCVQSIAIRQAGMAFRLMRHKIPVAPVVAFGGRPDGGGFVMCRISVDVRSARSWLALPRPGRRAMLRRIGQLLRQCHDAGCRGINANNLMIEAARRPRLRLIPNGDLFSSSKATEKAIASEIQRLAAGLGLVDRRDVVRMVRGYFGSDAIKPETLRIAAASLCLATRRAA